MITPPAMQCTRSNRLSSSGSAEIFEQNAKSVAPSRLGNPTACPTVPRPYARAVRAVASCVGRGRADITDTVFSLTVYFR